MKLTWYGTATIKIEIGGEKLLFDPFFRWNKKLEKPSLDEFTEVDYIFNTHPHFDHLCDLPLILKNSQAKIYGLKVMAERLKKDGVDKSKIQVLNPFETLITNNAKITPYPAKHVKFNQGIILKLVTKNLATFRGLRSCKILNYHAAYCLSNEIFAYFIEGEDKKILIFGSAGIDKNVELPKGVDALVWAYQGRTNMAEYSLPIIENLKPKMIVLDHFDNAYPPVTSDMDTDKFVDLMEQKHPEIKVIVPEYRQSIEI